jgi:DNA-binding CsgD family transcriptional regulator
VTTVRSLGVPASDSIFEVIERICRATKFAVGSDVLRDAIVEMGLSHVAYAAVNLPSIKRVRPLVAVTYAAEWQKHYEQEGYVNIDPVVRAGLGGVLPIDWSTIRSDDPLVVKFFGEAQEFKIGRMGLSVPIRGNHGEFALFNVTADVGPGEWRKRLPRLSRDLMLLAYQFHDWAVKVEGMGTDVALDLLSAREKDCLRWRSQGKTDSDIAQLLGISQSTVKFHLENSRTKLGAANTTHAVSKAIVHGLISIP